MAKTKRATKTYTGKPKSMGPKFCLILFICMLTVFSLIGNVVLIRSVRKEMRISFNYELNSAVETLVDNINTYHDFDSGSTAKSLALKMVENATWNDGRRHFWATSSEDSTEILAGEKDHSDYYTVAYEKTDFDFVVYAGYDEAYFNEHAYPETENLIRIFTSAILVVSLFALGFSIITFHRSNR